MLARVTQVEAETQGESEASVTVYTNGVCLQACSMGSKVISCSLKCLSVWPVVTHQTSRLENTHTPQMYVVCAKTKIADL